MNNRKCVHPGYKRNAFLQSRLDTFLEHLSGSKYHLPEPYHTFFLMIPHSDAGDRADLPVYHQQP
jgi:hypothetical protein